MYLIKNRVSKATSVNQKWWGGCWPAIQVRWIQFDSLTLPIRCNNHAWCKRGVFFVWTKCKRGAWFSWLWRIPWPLNGDTWRTCRVVRFVIWYMASGLAWWLWWKKFCIHVRVIIISFSLNLQLLVCLNMINKQKIKKLRGESNSNF